VAISRGKEKEALARKLGAHVYIDAEESDAAKELQKLGGARVILCTAPNTKAIAGLISGLGMGGQIIVVAGVGDPIQLHPGLLFRGDSSIKGWHGEKPGDALKFSVLFNILPMIETFPIEKAAEAFERMITSKVLFRSVLKIR
jgi:propanol-preferring alcohol dehydrogenase